MKKGVSERGDLMDALIDALEEVEWVQVFGFEDKEWSVCPACRRWKAMGHVLTCPVGAVLARVRGEEGERVND